MTFTEAELAQVDEFMRVYEAAPVAAKVAFHRPGILGQCVRWRRLIGSGAKSRHGIDPVEMLKWQQTRLARLRAWRAGRVTALH